MVNLGFKKFFVAGHDRGGRVAHRLARDHRKNVLALSVLDICPTLDMYELTTRDFAKAYFHWFFLIQPAWLPERMILANPRKWMKNCLDKWSGNHKFGIYIFGPLLLQFMQPGFHRFVRAVVLLPANTALVQ